MIETNEILRICLRRMAQLCDEPGVKVVGAVERLGEIAKIALAVMEGEAGRAGPREGAGESAQADPKEVLWHPIYRTHGNLWAGIPKATKEKATDAGERVADGSTGQTEFLGAVATQSPTAQTAHPTAHDARSNARPARGYASLGTLDDVVAHNKQPPVYSNQKFRFEMSEDGLYARVVDPAITATWRAYIVDLPEIIEGLRWARDTAAGEKFHPMGGVTP